MSNKSPGTNFPFERCYLGQATHSPPWAQRTPYPPSQFLSCKGGVLLPGYNHLFVQKAFSSILFLFFNMLSLHDDQAICAKGSFISSFPMFISLIPFLFLVPQLGFLAQCQTGVVRRYVFALFLSLEGNLRAPHK